MHVLGLTRSLTAVARLIGAVSMSVGLFVIAIPLHAETCPSFVLKWEVDDNVRWIGVGPPNSVYMSSDFDDRIEMFTIDGTPVTSWGTYGTGNGQFNEPRGIGVGPNGHVYVCDRHNYRVQEFTATGAFVRAWGSQGLGPGQFSDMSGLAVNPDGDVFVVDPARGRIQKFSSTGAFLTSFGDGQFSGAWAIACNQGNVYVSDSGLDRIFKFTNGGALVTQWGWPSHWEPGGIAVGAGSNVYVTDVGNSRIAKFDSNGTFLCQWGAPCSPIPDPGTMCWAEGVAVLGLSGREEVFIADTFNTRIQRFGLLPSVPLLSPPLLLATAGMLWAMATAALLAPRRRTTRE